MSAVKLAVHRWHCEAGRNVGRPERAQRWCHVHPSSYAVLSLHPGPPSLRIRDAT